MPGPPNVGAPSHIIVTILRIIIIILRGLIAETSEHRIGLKIPTK